MKVNLYFVATAVKMTLLGVAVEYLNRVIMKLFFCGKKNSCRKLSLLDGLLSKARFYYSDLERGYLTVACEKGHRLAVL